MKKIWLTALTAAFLGFTSFAQEQQDSTRNQTNQYRNNPQSDSTDKVQGSKSTRIHMQTDNSDSLQNDRPQTSGEHLGNEINEIDSAATDSLNNSGQQIRNRSEESRSNLRHDADQTRQQLRNEGERSDNNLKSDEEKARDGVNERSTLEPQDSTGVNGPRMANAPLEVVPDKEGPNNEVVYKFQGEMYYVDREKKELVKVSDSNLKDSKSELLIHEGPVTKDVSRKTRKSSSKG